MIGNHVLRLRIKHVRLPCYAAMQRPAQGSVGVGEEVGAEAGQRNSPGGGGANTGWQGGEESSQVSAEAS